MPIVIKDKDRMPKGTKYEGQLVSNVIKTDPKHLKSLEKSGKVKFDLKTMKL